jgi:hypothetical protein
MSTALIVKPENAMLLEVTGGSHNREVADTHFCVLHAAFFWSSTYTVGDADDCPKS